MAERQTDEVEELRRDDDIGRLLDVAPPAEPSDLEAARQYAGSLATEALFVGYEKGFDIGLDNDARLFGVVAASPSGQHWIRRFLDKDPAQSTYLIQLSPVAPR
jgi:hypothetical protein